MPDARYWIDSLRLRPHPEGGWFREAFRSAMVLPRSGLPEVFGGDRAASTAIYFLLTGDAFSALHSIHQDEAWHFYDGSPLTVHVFDESGSYSAMKVGRDLARGEEPLRVVPSGCLFGATVDQPDGYALVGCTVAPGFDFADFSMPPRAELVRRYPRHRAIIERLTR